MTSDGTSRRSFLIGSGAAAAAAWTAPTIVSAPAASAATQAPTPESILNFPAADAPIDHVVIVMMENRSFDHWLGWLADDPGYLAAGMSRYGPGFTVAGQQHQTFPSTSGPVDTTHVSNLAGVTDPYRGCGFEDPDHSWTGGRAQRDGGFLATGSGNDIFATGYYLGDDLPATAQLARRFAVCDHSHASVLGPTYPNREYLIAGQSYGIKGNAFPGATGFPGDTVVEKMQAVGATVRSYTTDLPVLLLWGTRMSPNIHPIADFFTDCAAGTLPNVSFVDPGFLGGSRTDNHPHGDIRAGERFVRDVFAAFVASPNYERGLAILTYDEWGGFFDHVAPPVFPDALASGVDADNFGQAGFRVPTILVSPYAQRGFVDHRTYDHTSILRFLHWRFGGAPPEGPGGGATWNLTLRDRNALNIGASLVMTPDPAADVDLTVAIDPPSADCAPPGAPVGSGAVAAAELPPGDKHSFEELHDAGYFEGLGFEVRPSPMVQAWVTG
jgi:phospholipase C